MADNIEVLPWLKTLPVAPEFHPTLAEFQDPIAYIFKIEPKASKFGICKIVPPVSNSPKKAVIYNFNRSLAARNPNSPPTFTTRQQQIGFCPRKHRPVRRSVWQSGENYTLPQFEAKAKAFEKGFVKRGSKKVLTALEVETLYWKASVDTPRTVEYANDMPGSAFGLVKSGGREMGEEKLVGDTAWNMRGVSRAKGSLLRFMKEEIPGVTSPMVYVAMMFSWFAWHVEDHDLHSLNYLHMGAGKTWYGVPREAAVAFEEVIRVQGYGGEVNPLVTFATLCEKTTVMSPEVLTNSGVPCCRLVQNAGEFVVTFPRAYHSGFSHGFNVGEAANIATPEWLKVAKEAAIRRASINCPPMVSHFQLLYDLALSLCSRVPKSIPNEPRSSRLRDKKKGEGEALIKESFVKDVMSNNDLLHILGDESSVVLLPQSSLDDSTYSKSRVSSRLRGRLSVGLCSPVEEMKSSKSLAYGSFMLDKKKGLKTFVGPNPTKGKFFSKYDGNKISLMTDTENGCSLASEACKSELETGKTAQGDKSPDQGLFSCVTCGILNFACVAIVQPTEATANHLMSATDGSFLDSQDVGPGNVLTLSEPNPRDGTRRQRACDGLFDIPAQSDDLIQPVYRKNIVVSDSGIEKGPSSLGLLALAYGNSSDSDEEENEADHPVYDSESRLSIEANSYRNIPVQALDSNLGSKTHVYNCRSTHQSFDCLTDLETDDIAFTESHMLAAFEKSTMPYVLRSDEDSSRFHVFCLPHAAEVVQQLRPIGGAHVLLLCHPDYPELEAEAKSVAEEMGMNYVWNDIGFREATEEDENQIRSALQSEEGLHGNADWTVKLGINLFYTVNLSRSPLYRKQMAYNSIIYKAFGRSSQDYNATQPKPQRKGPLRRKKIVMAGKWCGKVWMSNQVHPLLAEKETEEEEEEEGEEEEVHAWEKPEVKREREVHAHKKPEVKQERVLESPKPAQSTSTIRKSERKRKSTFKVGKIEEAKSPKMVDSVNASDDSGDEIIPQPRRNMRSKKPKRETRNPLKTLDRNKRKLVIDDNTEAGPSARLRRRIVMPRKDLEAAKPVEAKPILKKHRPNKTRKKPLPAIATPASLKVKDEDEDGDGDEEGEYTCDIEGCSMSFGSKQELDVHKLNVCPVKGCGKTFFSHKYLLQHRRVHEDDRPLKCPWKGCNMAFKWAWARTEHIRVHTGARPYVCAEEGCGQTFRFVSDFSRHKRKTGHSKKNKGG